MVTHCLLKTYWTGTDIYVRFYRRLTDVIEELAGNSPGLTFFLSRVSESMEAILEVIREANEEAARDNGGMVKATVVACWNEE